MTTDDVTLLQPASNSLGVSYHPSWRHGDCISVQLEDAEHGRVLVALHPEAARYLATMLATALESPRIGAVADQMRAAQRDG